MSKFPTVAEIESYVISNSKPTCYFVIDSGFDATVVTIGNKFALKFPKHVWGLENCIRQQKLLELLNKYDIPNVPTVFDSVDDPFHLKMSYIPGDVLTRNDVEQLEKQTQTHIGEQLGVFLAKLHSQINSKLIAEVKSIQSEISWHKYFSNIFDVEDLLLTKSQLELVEKERSTWNSYQSKDNLVLVHDDFHLNNLLFNESKLSGVVDFAGVSIGKAEQDFRQLYRYNINIFEAACSSYEKTSGNKLSIEKIQNWAHITEMATYFHRLNHKEIEHPAFVRAAGNLNEWLPNGSWENY